jgi:aspartate aminotransferase-like enzyme
MTPNPFIKQYLMTAGPTPLPPKVSTAMAEPILYHRDPAGVELYARVLERLPAVFRTRNDVLLFASSGSGAMEAAVANRVRGRQVRRALDRARRGLRRADRALRARLGPPPRRG